MKYSIKTTALSDIQQDIVFGIFEDGILTPTAKVFDTLADGHLSALIESGELHGKIGQVLILHQQSSASRVFIVGCGKSTELNERRYKTLLRHLCDAIKTTQCRELVNFLGELEIKDRDLYWNIRFAIETLEEHYYVFDQFKTQNHSAKTPLEEIIFNLNEKDEKITALAGLAIQHALATSIGIRSAKDIANYPPNICNPTFLAQKANELASQNQCIKTTIIDEKEMKKLGMNAYLAVSQGSCNEAKMAILEYRHHPDPNAKPIVLIGKGLTFDAGGISLKPSESMDEMKYDMCGSAAVYGVMNALCELNLPLNVIGILAGCENLPDGNAYRPGDILTTMEGLTVEVLNTDAEGRLVLCDVLSYAKRFNPDAVIDIATLTGACVVALGQHNSGLMSTDEILATQLLEAAMQTQDKAWRLPLDEEYDEQLTSPFADLANIGGRWGGAITAGAFLSHFAKTYPWAHLDIAGTAWKQGKHKGATGRPVNLLVQFLINRTK